MVRGYGILGFDCKQGGMAHVQEAWSKLVKIGQNGFECGMCSVDGIVIKLWAKTLTLENRA